MSVPMPTASRRLTVFTIFAIRVPCGGGAEQTEQGPRDGPARHAASVYERSVALAEAVVARHPDKTRVLLELGNVHFRQGRFRKALETYDEILHRAPSSSDARLRRAISCWRLGRTEDAISSYRKVLENVDANTTRARLELAVVLYLEERQEEAASELRMVLYHCTKRSGQRLFSIEIAPRGIRRIGRGPHLGPKRRELRLQFAFV